MHSHIVTFLPWVLSILTLTMMWMAGNKHHMTWLVGLFNQALWLVWIITSETWGLVPMNIALWAVYLQNHLKWRHDDAVQTDAGGDR
jgi:hypothetical protein